MTEPNAAHAPAVGKIAGQVARIRMELHDLTVELVDRAEIR